MLYQEWFINPDRAGWIIVIVLATTMSVSPIVKTRSQNISNNIEPKLLGHIFN